MNHTSTESNASLIEEGSAFLHWTEKSPSAASRGRRNETPRSYAKVGSSSRAPATPARRFLASRREAALEVRNG
jgi:hypothetical protein